ncbi:MAG: TatD family hydrolase [Methylococcaceae bacterium]
MLVDSHCHLDRLDLSPFEGDFSKLMAEIANQGIVHQLCVSINMEAYSGMCELVADYAQVSVSVGVHPNETTGHEPTVEELIALASPAKVVAVGETGLDYYRSAGDNTAQQERFRRHIAAARAVNKPLIIHTREARTDTLRILKEEGADQVGGVLHCFTEDWDTAQAAMDLGFYVSFSGIVTFKNATSVQETARKMPEDRLLIETDSPYLAPAPMRGKPNYPYYVRHVAHCVASLRDMDFDRLAETTTRNYQRLFGLPAV